MACARETTPLSMAFAFTFSELMPDPSSMISITTCPPSWKARMSNLPDSGFPAARRSAGFSIPWSKEFRIMCVSGSFMASMIVLSNSVSSPSSLKLISFSQARAMSRTIRGNLFKTVLTGCIRVFIIPSCSSLVTKLNT